MTGCKTCVMDSACYADKAARENCLGLTNYTPLESILPEGMGMKRKEGEIIFYKPLNTDLNKVGEQ